MAYRRPVAQVTQSQSGRVTTVPCPLGGWNARDNIANMEPTDAPIMTNFFPATSSVQVRQGYSNWATGLGDQVESLMSYNPSSGVNKMYAAAGSNIFDVSSNGAVGAAVQTGLSNARWQHINFANSAGSWLIMVNGADQGRTFNGTTWANMTLTGTGSPDSANMIHLTSYANRIWMIQKNSLTAWYLGLGAVTGAATSFDLTPIFVKGSYLVAIGVWTVDSGSSTGMTDYLCFVTNQGEVAIYSGTDPTQATGFSKQGVWKLGAPMSTRCLMKFGGDLVYIGRDGLAPFTKALASSRVNTQINLTGKIDGQINYATSAYAGIFGWQTILYPTNNMLFLNIPVSVGQQEQYVMNTITGSWCRFQGWAANCWELYNERLYFGGNGIVGWAYDGGYSDNNSVINAECLQAFSYLDGRQLKQVRMVRPVLQTNGSPGINIGVNMDFDTTTPIGTPTFAPSQYGRWDSAVWDNAIWGANQNIVKDWQWAGGVGYAVAAHIVTASNGISTNWVSTDYLIADGGVL